MTLAKEMADNGCFSVRDFRSYIKLRVSLGKTRAVIFEELRTISPTTAPSLATVYRWVKKFSNGKTSIDDNRGKIRKPPVTDEKTVARVKKLVDADPRVSGQFIAQTLDISSGSAFKILKQKLRYKKVCARWVPHLLTQNDQTKRVDYAQRLLNVYENCDQRRLDEIIIGDETWVY